MAQFIINCSDRISRPTAHLDKEVRIRRVDLHDLDLRHQAIDEVGVPFELARRFSREDRPGPQLLDVVRLRPTRASDG